MSIVSLLTKDIKKVQIASVVLDASIEETHTHTADVTESPIESGYSITDHVIIKPTKIVIEGMVSKTPLANLGVGVFGGDLGGLGSPASLLRKATPLIGAGAGNVLGALTSYVDGPFGGVTKTAASAGLGSLASLVVGNNNPETAYKQLTLLFENRAPFSVYTRLASYQDMVITGLTFPKTATIGKSLRFTIEMTQLRIVSAIDIKIPKEILQKASSKIGASAVDLGQAGTKKAGPLTSGFVKLGKFSGFIK